VNHMKTAQYKLNEYRIIEDDNGRLMWEKHYGFGGQRRGMCLIHNDILIIAPYSHEEIGYLKGEFLDRMEKLPLWNKTKHYCFSSDLQDVASGRRLDQNLLDQMSFSINIGSNRSEPIRSGDPGVFRLAKYRITVGTNSQVTWQAYGRMNRVLSGQCIIHSGVLFIGPEEQDKEEESKGDFLKELETLPQWDRTKIWSRSLALWPCHPWPLKRKPSATVEKETWRPREEGYAIYEKPPMERTQRPEGQFRSLSSSCFRSRKVSLPGLRLPEAFRFRKPSWRRSRGAKIRLIWLILLVLAGLLFGLIMSLHSVKERFHGFHSSEKHHHR
jgi:hypothetical protein